MARRFVTTALMALLAGVAALAALDAAEEKGAPARMNVDDFEAEPTPEGLPLGWQELHFQKVEKHTAYRVVKEDGNAHLHAQADESASGLVKRVSVNLKEYPVLKWRWRIDHTLKKGDARTKKGDDYAARIYVNFRYDPEEVGWWTRLKYSRARKRLGEYPPLHTLNYIWANRLERGAFIRNAYTDRAMMVAVESGDAKAGRWVNEQRNVYEDYKTAFGEEPPEVYQVAIMTDTDNTQSTASADYDDIRFERRPEPE